MRVLPPWIMGCFLATNIALADSGIEFSGFGTLSAISSSSDVYGFRPDISYDDGALDGELDFLSSSLLGVQFDYPISNQFSLTGQAVIRDFTDNSLDNMISQFFLKYNVNPALNIRLGRLPVDLFSLTEFRDIGYAYPWAAAPTEVYGLVPIRALDGADISYTFRLKNSALTTRLHGGVATSVSALQGDVVELKLKNVVGVSIDWSDIDWFIKLRHTQSTFAENPTSIAESLELIALIPPQIWPGVDDFIEGNTFTGKTIDYSSLGASYTLMDWTLAGEYSWIRSELTTVENVDSGYLSLTYRIGDLAVYTLLGMVDSNTYKFDEYITVPPEFFPGYDDFVAGVTAAMNSYSSNQTSISLGARYELTDSMALKLQWTNTDIDEWGGALWYSSKVESQPETINTIFLGLSFIF